MSEGAAASAPNRQRRVPPGAFTARPPVVRRAVFLHRRRFDCGVLLVQNLRRGNKEAARAVGGRLLPRPTQDGGSPDIYEHFRIRSSTHSTALHVAFGAAVVAFGLAAAATVHSLQTGTGNLRLLRIALLIWPLITGVPAFMVAFVLTVVLARIPRWRPVGRPRCG